MRIKIFLHNKTLNVEIEVFTICFNTKVLNIDIHIPQYNKQ